MVHPFQNPDLPLADRVENLLSLLSVDEKASQLLYTSAAIPRLGIPAYNWWNEALHGVARAGKATVFPQTIGLAATWDPVLIERVFTAVSDEARAKHHAALRAGQHGQYRGLSYWTPNINIFRDPRWGRGQETYGEDPVLTSRLGTAVVRGLQGNDPRYLKLAACAKHFAVHSGPEGDRHGFDARVGEKDLRETYLPAFKALVDAGVESVMGAYNRTNGEVCCASPTLMGKILRGEWGFKGHYVSDCWAIRDFHEHHKVTATFPESAALALKEGCDINCGCSFEHLIPALLEKRIDEADLDRSLRRVLTSRFKLGMFDPADRVPWSGIPLEVVDSPAHRELAYEAAVQSAVLLKNNGVLPLKSSVQSVYVTGPNASGTFPLMGNYYGLNPRMVTFLEGIAARVPEGVAVDFRPGCLVERKAPNPVEWAIFEAGQFEVTVAFLGFDPSLEGEEGDALASEHIGDRPDIALPANQLEFLTKLRAKSKNLVVVLCGGGAVSIPPELADAILMVWYPGEEGGRAVADILFGDRYPSGKLPVTFYQKIEDLPAYSDYAMEGRTYRYFRGTALWPFGWGLGYTAFTLEGAGLSVRRLAQDGSVELKVMVRNTGNGPGTETVQVYVESGLESKDSHGDNGRTVQPLASLRDFARVDLGPGKTRSIVLNLPATAFLVHGTDGRQFWPVGRARVFVGTHAPMPHMGSGGCEGQWLDLDLV